MGAPNIRTCWAPISPTPWGCLRILVPLPQMRNSISLDPVVKDSWGLPAYTVTFDYHPDDIATMQWILTKQVEILEAAGAKKIWTTGISLPDMMPTRH